MSRRAPRGRGAGAPGATTPEGRGRRRDPTCLSCRRHWAPAASVRSPAGGNGHRKSDQGGPGPAASERDRIGPGTGRRRHANLKESRRRSGVRFASGPNRTTSSRAGPEQRGDRVKEAVRTQPRATTRSRQRNRRGTAGPAGPRSRSPAAASAGGGPAPGWHGPLPGCSVGPPGGPPPPLVTSPGGRNVAAGSQRKGGRAGVT